MSAIVEAARRVPNRMSAEEWRLRVELAACYRIFDFLGWIEMIYNHITVRVPGPSPQYLINPYGLNYEEVTARNLVLIDIEGNVLDGSAHPVNRAGFVIHSAIHAARADAHCVVHTHTTAGIAIACKAEGLRHDNFYSAAFAGQVAYHDFEGISTDEAEKPRLVADLGAKNVLILRNHGLLVIGPTVPQTLKTYWAVQRACEVQYAADAMGGRNMPIEPKVFAAMPRQIEAMRAQGETPDGFFFDALVRRARLTPEELAG
jgi:ribulose-5-phosphate 4-epimerase/fuculose-1-phosphate aldolase